MRPPLVAIDTAAKSDSKTDNTRARELYRYFQPPEPPPSSPATLSAHEASSPDTTLTALAQLCALRLHAKRAMISLIDRENQYFVAESTKTLDLVNNNKSEVEGDGLWFGCGTVEKSGRLCEKTIELPPAVGCAPCFTVTDLSKDERFKDLPFVTGDPNFRFYAGTPLTTKRGINIGSLFVLDNVVRDRLNLDQEAFLGTIAQTIMKHMETASEAEERRKVMRFSHGMNAFVEGKTNFTPEDTMLKINRGTKDRTGSDEKFEASRKVSSSRSAKDPVSLVSQRASDQNGSPSEHESSQEESDAGKMNRNVDTGHRMTFARAANILCDSLDVRDRGGVVFYDTTSRLRQNSDVSVVDRSAERKSGRPAEIVSFSTSEESLGMGPHCDKIKSFDPIDEHLLQSLVAKYPRGKLWSFDEDGSLSSSEEDIMSPRLRTDSEARRQSRASRKQIEATLLQKHFSGVRQLLFLGLWDAGSMRWFTGGFAWTTSSRQIFSRETELGFFQAFGNSVMAEVSRLASMAADRQKADFIGSISHEFRSPLHGILASAEFLAETEVDGFQGGLVDTISSCGRTLLDTINHILDYSKINTFERSFNNARKRGSKLRGPEKRRIGENDAPPMMNIYQTIDVAAVTEEVVEGVYAGQVYQDISSTDVTDFSHGAQAKALERGVGKKRKKLGLAKEVEVIIDIAHENYVFTTQPGALKRVIMNIFGNALKYTQKGSIVVKVSLHDVENTVHDGTETRTLELKITDTGKGISSEYLRTSLFNPFCQEDTLASGTGLGLSIVRSIVTMLHGSIDIQSEVGRGTDVIIRLPLSRLPGNSTPVSTPNTVATDGSGSAHDAINILFADYSGSVVALHGFDDTGVPNQASQSGRALKDCIENWFELKTTSPSTNYAGVDLVIADEKELPQLMQHEHVNLPTVVLCSNATRSQARLRHQPSHRLSPSIVEFVSKPVGPHKLAKALHVCLERAKNLKNGLAPTLTFSDEESPMESEGDTVVPELEHLTLEPNASGSQPFQVQTNGVLTASDTKNAKMAIDNSSYQPIRDEAESDSGGDFPFPTQEGVKDGEMIDEESQDEGATVQERQERPGGDLTRQESRRPPLISRMTEPLTKVPFRLASTLALYDEMAAYAVRPPPGNLNAAKKGLLNEDTAASLTASNMALHNGETPLATTPTAPIPEREKRPPRLLLVDDNKINLRLLETYMKKRKYKFVDSAEDGQLAVQAAEAHDSGYDIIFMDISMPIMNGFEATRAIRNIEEARSHNQPNIREHLPALIIALTGLASSRDQTEAFASGVDLFLTKPVSFKEVGRILDNWESHGGLKPVDEDNTP